MSFRYLLILLLGVFVFSQEADSTKQEIELDACMSCHEEIDEDFDTPIMPHIMDDVHFKVGLGCADCHGGDPEAFDDEDESMWNVDSFIGVPEKSELPDFCGTCHSDVRYMKKYNPQAKTDQVAQYKTSKHGILLFEDDEEKVAVCTDCHSVHGILEVDNPKASVYPLNLPETCANCHSDAAYMEGFDIPTDQLDKYKSSVHGHALFERRDISAPVCNDCHGNHGATPPEFDDISYVCSGCHVNNSDLFKKSHLNDLFIKEDIPQCIGCHSNHDIEKPTDEFLNWTGGSICINCHDENEHGDSRKIADTFYGIIDSMKQQIDIADHLVETAEKKGMEISDLYYDLEEAHKSLIQTRTSIHSFNEEFVREVAKPGNESALKAIEGANKALDEFDVRRKGLFFASLIISLLIVAIYLKIKDMESENNE